MARWLCCSGWVEPDAACQGCGLLGPAMAVERVSGKRRPVSGNRVAEILWLREGGLVAREIAERMGCHIATVQKHLRRYGMGRLSKKKIRKSR